MSGPEDPVGSLGEEAAKLLGALSDWSREQAGGTDGTEATDGTGATDGGARDLWREIDDHVATGSEECRYCPVCRVIHAVRRTSPEARQHLADATLSLARTVAALLETPAPTPGAQPDDAGRRSTGSGGARPPGVQRIDLDDGPEESTEEPRG